MSNSLVLLKELNTELGQRPDPVALAQKFIPRLAALIETCQDAEQANELRHGIGSIHTYVRNALPKIVKDRHRRFEIAFPGAVAYAEASRKAGALWDRVENKAKAGGDRVDGHNNHRQNFDDGLSATDAGFVGRQDAMTCSRISRLDPEDWRLYEEHCQKNMEIFTLGGLYRLWNSTLRHTETLQETSLPDGVFEVIVLDPPWPYGTEYDAEGRRAASPYPEMSLEEISQIKLPAADNSILWLWTTHKFMRASFPLLDAWEFREVSILTWEKNNIGLGQWLRSNSEFCIMAVKGSPAVNLTNERTVIHSRRREHSRKPDEFYSMVDSLCPGRKLDMFSREPRTGWEQFGNDVNKF